MVKIAVNNIPVVPMPVIAPGPPITAYCNVPAVLGDEQVPNTRTVPTHRDNWVGEPGTTVLVKSTPWGLRMDGLEDSRVMSNPFIGSELLRRTVTRMRVLSGDVNGPLNVGGLTGHFVSTTGCPMQTIPDVACAIGIFQYGAIAPRMIRAARKKMTVFLIK